MARFLGFFLIFLSFSLDAHVLVMTHSHNRPDFIKIQHDCFKKFLRDKYEFVVFNDARSHEVSKEIKATCKTLGLRCIRIPQEIHDRAYLKRESYETFNNANTRCANVVQYSLNTMGFDHDGLVVIIDSDMFLVKDFSIEKYLKDFAMAGVRQSNGHVSFFWNGLVFFNMNRLPDKKSINFNCGNVEGKPTDVGGYLHYYLQAHPNLPLCNIDCIHTTALLCESCKQMQDSACSHNLELLNSLQFNTRTIQLVHDGIHNVEFLANRAFLHYRGGTNWDHKSSEYHQRKTNLFNEYMRDILR